MRRYIVRGVFSDGSFEVFDLITKTVPSIEGFWLTDLIRWVADEIADQLNSGALEPDPPPRQESSSDIPDPS